MAELGEYQPISVSASISVFWGICKKTIEDNLDEFFFDAFVLDFDVYSTQHLCSVS